jgi:hypothetical protein
MVFIASQRNFLYEQREGVMDYLGRERIKGII